MNSLSQAISETLKHLRSHYFILAILSLGIGIVSHLPKFLMDQSFFWGIILWIASTLLQLWVLIATHQIVYEKKFELNSQLELFSEKFLNWMWASLAAMHEMFGAIFPYFFPMLKKMASLMIVAPQVLFSKRTDLDALKVSADIQRGNEWKFLAVFFGPLVLVSILSNLAAKASGIAPEFFQITMTAIFAPFMSVLILQLWNRQVDKISVLPEEHPVDYKKKAIRALPRALLGLSYLIAIFAVWAVGVVLYFKLMTPK